MLKEPEIKLFGRNIYLPDTSVTIGGGEWSSESSNGSGDYDRCFEDRRGEEVGGGEILEQRDEDAETEEQDENTNTPSESKTPPTNDDDETKTETETETEPNSQKKSLKKPDKILPCPRCKSMDTKFCYYNNYNVNQPRHFCKSCQRYWTAGGTMRNVPVGAGRRKNKNSASHCRHITISEAFQAAIVDAPNGYHHNLKFKPNATVLSFGPDPPLSESMADKILPNDSSLAVPNPPLDGGKNGYLQPAMPVPCIPGVPWPYSAVPVPAFFHPVPYYTAPVWNSGGWNLPWLSVPSNTNKNISSSTTTNSLLGKHSRSGDDQTSPLLDPNTPQGKEAPKRKSSETTIVVPKTLRIDDPEEAAKSSIWSTLGIKYDAVNREGLLKAFQPKIDHKKTAAAAASSSPLLQANPAALSRSLAFQETA